MGKHWVKAIVPLTRYDIEGAFRAYQPGDWFEVHNQEMLELLARRAVNTTAQVIKAEFKLKDAGVLLLPGAQAPSDIEDTGVEVKHADTIELPWSLTAVLDKGALTTTTSTLLGLMRIDCDDDYPAWEMAAILESATELARDVGTVQEKERTLAIVGDLRVPIYNPSMVWIRRTTETENVIQLWNAEKAQGTERHHAFLRAIYQHGVMLCTLPANWIGEWIRA